MCRGTAAVGVVGGLPKAYLPRAELLLPTVVYLPAERQPRYPTEMAVHPVIVARLQSAVHEHVQLRQIGRPQRLPFRLHTQAVQTERLRKQAPVRCGGEGYIRVLRGQCHRFVRLQAACISPAAAPVPQSAPLSGRRSR